MTATRNEANVVPRLLVVDDEADVRHLFVDYFTQRGYSVQGASSAGEALMMMEQHRPDVVLLDIHMPGMSGVELLRKIGPTTPPIAVIVVTANTDVALAQAALKLGACDYVTKPCDFDYLDVAVRTALQWRTEPSGRASDGRVPDEGQWAELMYAVLGATREMGDQGRLSIRERLQNAVVLAVRAARHGDRGETGRELRALERLLRAATELGDLPLSATLAVEAIRAKIHATVEQQSIEPRS